MEVTHEENEERYAWRAAGTTTDERFVYSRVDVLKIVLGKLTKSQQESVSMALETVLLEEQANGSDYAKYK